MLYLEIVRGATAYPHRPVYEGHFLIGSGGSCDLRLGGDGVPLVHTILRAAEEQTEVESLSSHPPLLINGRPCQSAVLTADDVVQIGSIQLAARFRTEAVEAAPAAESPVSTDASSLSTDELIDALQEDLRLVDEDEKRQAVGIQMLLRAAEKVAAQQPVEPVADETAEAFPRIVETESRDDTSPAHTETERLLVALNGIVDDLDGKIGHIREKERTFTAAADELLTMQSRFGTLLERVLERLGAASDDDGPEHRVSA